MGGWRDIFKSRPKEVSIESIVNKETEARHTMADVSAEFPGMTYRNISTVSFNGEKNLGEIGPALNYTLDYQMLRARSWQAQLESDIAQTAVKRIVSWTIGNGLKPQAEPMENILEANGIKLDKQKFQKDVETRFNLFRKTKCDYSGMLTLNELEWEAERNAIIGGDILVIQRYQKGKHTIQLIDGAQVMSPYYGSEWYPKSMPDGHRLIDGVEIDETGKHIAFWVRSYVVNGDIKDLYAYKFDRIEAWGKKSGLQMAYLYYGLKLKITNTRGIPLLSACLEKIAKLDRYTEATLGQAEEAAKVSYFVQHDVESEGKSPWLKSTIQGYNVDPSLNVSNRLMQTDDGETIANKIQATTNKQAFNMPPGSEIKMLVNENPLYFKDFYEKNSDSLYAVLELPPNIATGKYNDSFSASRAAIKDWEHTLDVRRFKHSTGFIQPIYNFWLEVCILEGKVTAPEYVLSKRNGNTDVVESYRSVRFVGPNVPHIDPVKEVQAARLILGTAGAHIPLSDVENVTENLGLGEASENIPQFAQELDLTNKLKIVPTPVNQQVSKEPKETD